MKRAEKRVTFLVGIAATRCDHRAGIIKDVMLQYPVEMLESVRRKTTLAEHRAWRVAAEDHPDTKLCEIKFSRLATKAELRMDLLFSRGEPSLVALHGQRKAAGSSLRSGRARK